MSGETLSFALWQGAGRSGDVGANLDGVYAIAREAAAQGAELLLFPECFLTGYKTGDPQSVAAQVTEARIAQLERIAQETGLCLVLGSYLIDTGRLTNAALVIDPEKGLIARYRKRMLYGAWEKAQFQRGVQPISFSFRGWRIGLRICLDMEFPELVRDLARQGCDLVVAPTALMAPYAQVARLLIPARAMENQIYVAYAHRVGREANWRYVGESVVAGPEGETVARADGETEGLMIAGLRRAVLCEARADLCYLDEDIG